jgi:hypothetical protein
MHRGIFAADRVQEKSTEIPFFELKFSNYDRSVLNKALTCHWILLKCCSDHFRGIKKPKKIKIFRFFPKKIFWIGSPLCKKCIFQPLRCLPTPIYAGPGTWNTRQKLPFGSRNKLTGGLSGTLRFLGVRAFLVPKNDQFLSVYIGGTLCNTFFQIGTSAAFCITVRVQNFFRTSS